ncbi:MAG: serine/threonine-protein kinase [Polyangiales bacterium]
MVHQGAPSGELPTLVGNEGVVSAATAAAPRTPLPARYVDLGVLARGSFGEVRRVRDVALDRVLVLKLLHADLAHLAAVRWRFSAEIRVTAALQHPGVVPVYDHGELADGRLWYAMKEVRGTTFGAIFTDLHAAASPAGFAVTPGGWTFRRVVDAFARVVQTVAYAHRRGVVHRDLKPENLMAGEFGEVLVMDWGLARRVDQAEPDAPEGALSGPRGADLTQHGDVLGTPAYMPPEQAMGARDQHGPPSDVYALGAILYHLLAGRAPYAGGAREVVQQVRAGPPMPIDDAVANGPPVPDELRRACERAMVRDAGVRCTADALATELLAWLDGVRRREQAVAALEAARATEAEMGALRAKAAEATRAARATWATLRAFDPVEAKRPAWDLEDEAEATGRAVALAEARWIQGVHGALSLDPELPEAHDALAEHYRGALVEAERERRTLDAARAEAMLRAHDRGRFAAFLRERAWCRSPPIRRGRRRSCSASSCTTVGWCPWTSARSA